MPVERLVETVRQARPALVVITGGEPLQQDLTSLCQALAPLAVPRHLETSGVAPLSGAFEWITLSPKRHRPPQPALLAHCHELKVVIHEPADLDFAMAMATACRTTGRGSSPAPQALPSTWRRQRHRRPPGHPPRAQTSWQANSTPNGASACKPINGWGCVEGIWHGLPGLLMQQEVHVVGLQPAPAAARQGAQRQAANGQALQAPHRMAQLIGNAANLALPPLPQHDP